MRGIIANLAQQESLPAEDIIGNFYASENIEPSLDDHWESVPEHELTDIAIPGYPSLCPYKAWRVETRQGPWIVVMWYDGTGWDDDAWLYYQPE